MTHFCTPWCNCNSRQYDRLTHYVRFNLSDPTFTPGKVINLEPGQSIQFVGPTYPPHAEPPY